MRRACLILLAALAACSDPSALPEAEVLAQMPASLDPDDDGADDLTIQVRYADGDGDLGGGVAEVVDCRAEGLVTALELPPIASAAAVAEGVPIEGELELLVADVGRVEPAPALPAACTELGVTTLAAGETVFCVILVDAAGHRGRGDCTAPVTIL
jgi:hypothetical protein